MALEQLIKNKDEIISLYNNGMLQREIADMFNTSKSSIARLLHSAGIVNKTVLNKIDIENIIVLYNNGLSIVDIAKQFNVGERRVSQILKDNNVEIIPSWKRNMKYVLNEHYFDVINNPNQAYIIGFIAADGCVHGNCLTISLQDRDVDILARMNLEFGSNRPLRFIDYKSKHPTYQNQYSLSITNWYFVNKLKEYGLVENKSMYLSFPYWMSTELIPHYLRGLFDGDGYVSKNKNNAKLSIVSTTNMCNSLAIFLRDNLDITGSVYLCHNNIDSPSRMLQVSGKKQISKFLNYIYNDADMYLQRKYDIYKSLYFN